MSERTVRRWGPALVGLLLAFTACGTPGANPAATQTRAAELGQLATLTAPTATSAPTATLAPTWTPAPTATPEPTATPPPSPTATPTPTPRPTPTGPPTATPTPGERDLLLRDLDAFERWYRDDTQLSPADRSWCSRPDLGNPHIGPDETPACRAYQAALRRYLTRHPRLNAYTAWLVDTRLAEVRGQAPLFLEAHANPTFAEMRDPRYLDRYLAERH